MTRELMANTRSSHVEVAIAALHYASPAIILSYYIGSTLISACFARSLSLKTKDQRVCRRIIIWLLCGLIGVFALEVIVRVLIIGVGFSNQHENVYIICSIIVWGMQILALSDTQFPVWYPYIGCWAAGLLFEILLLLFINLSHPPRIVFDYLTLTAQGLRICIILTIIGLFACHRTRTEVYENVDAEQQALLRKQNKPHRSDGTKASTDYGATQTTNETSKKPTTTQVDLEYSSDEDNSGWDILKADEARMLKRLSNDGNVWTYLRGFWIFVPYLWPFHSKRLQLRAILVIVCLLTNSALNLLLPIQLGHIIDVLHNGFGGVWMALGLYGSLYLVSDSLLGWFKSWCWLPIEQYGQQALVVAAHTHAMNLSCDYHDSHEGFAIYQAVVQGQTITTIVEMVCFEIMPMLIDLFLAAACLCYLFGPYLAVVVGTTSLLYLYITIKLVSMTNDSRRMVSALHRRKWSLGYQSVSFWVTASLFNNIAHEQKRYSKSVDRHLKAAFSLNMARELIAFAQSFVMTLGMVIAAALAIHSILSGERTSGDFVILLTYWSQLRGPLAFFSRAYKSLSSNMMDAERLLELFQVKPTVDDKRNAKDLKLYKGGVKFSDVSFTYDPRKPGIQNVSFEIPGGSTVALVGETGSGKSTLLKLLNRFYDVNSGSICIDGQDIRDITLKSLRGVIGVVPQEPAIFDGTILSNVLYGRLGSTFEDVQAACKAAAIHDKIMTFPDGYFSKVGRAGVKVSGGEKQRLAIARAIIKRPDIILLDEATSAVDTDTEQKIQEAFRALCNGKTTFIVAHRLSTVMSADIIMVVKDGRIIEFGSHEDLIHSKGKYEDLWAKQITVRSAGNHSTDDITNGFIVDDFAPSRQTVDSIKTPELMHSRRSAQHESESSKASTSPLKPDAPEFVPKFRRSLSTSDASTTDPKMINKGRPKQEKQQRKIQEKIGRKTCARSGKSFGGDNQLDDDDDDLETTQKDTKDSQDETSNRTETHLGKENRVLLRHPRYPNRRHQSKSEPFGNLEDYTDGIQENDTDVAAGWQPYEINATGGKMEQQRRVSAPGNSHSGLSNDTPIGVEHRRSRHWRLKKKTEASKSNIDSGSTTSSNEQPIVPANTPTE